MSRFTSAPYSLAIGQLIVGTINAFNIMGDSGSSSPNTDGITAKKIPYAAVTNLARGALTSKTSVQLTWTGISTDT